MPGAAGREFLEISTLLNYRAIMHDLCIGKPLILALSMISMDKLRVYMLKAGKAFEGSTSDVCEQISNQIDSDFAILRQKDRHSVS